MRLSLALIALRQAKTTGLLLAVGIGIGMPAMAQQSLNIEARVQANHTLYLPDGPSPFPTVIAVPGCSGVSFTEEFVETGNADSLADSLFRRHYPRMAERLAAQGYAVVLLDYLGAHGVETACGGVMTVGEVGEYVTATADFARSLDVVDESRITLLGWSRGGGGVLDALTRASQSGEVTFGSVIAFYPNCHESEAWNLNVPTLLLLGEMDDIDPPELCEALVANLADASLVTVHRYEGARHGFDVRDAPSVLELSNGTSIGFDADAALQGWRAADAHLLQYP